MTGNLKKLIFQDINSLKKEEKIALPTSLDMAEAAQGLQRIQSYYKMNPTYLAEGIYDTEGQLVFIKEIISVNFLYVAHYI